jgi:hypothetical protein
MILKRKNPCKECPFRTTSPRTWLGPWTVDSILRQVHGDAGLACHMSVAKIQKGSPDISDEELMDKSHVCVGSVLHATKSCKLYYMNPLMMKIQLALKRFSIDNILGYTEFRKHHSSLVDED